MISLQITDLKQFMHIFLRCETFDSFDFEEGFIKLGYTVHLDGHINADYYEGEKLPLGNFLAFRDIRPIIFEHIKGKKMPVSFQFVLHASTEYTHNLITKLALSIDPETVSALLFTVRFDHGKLSILTGTAFTTFVPDKSLEHAWDQNFKKSLDNLSISYKEAL